MRTFKYLQKTHKVLFLMSFILNGCYLQTLNYVNIPFKLLSSLFKPSVEPTLSSLLSPLLMPLNSTHFPHPHILVGGNTVKQHNNKPK